MACDVQISTNILSVACVHPKECVFQKPEERSQSRRQRSRKLTKNKHKTADKIHSLTKKMAVVALLSPPTNAPQPWFKLRLSARSLAGAAVPVEGAAAFETFLFGSRA